MLEDREMIIDTGTKTFWITIFFGWLALNYICIFFSGIMGAKKSDTYDKLDSVGSVIAGFIAVMVFVSP